MELHSRRAAFATLALAIALAFVATGCTTTRVVSAPANVSPSTVTSTGSGKVSAKPDQAEMNFGVSATNANAKTALDQVSGKAQKLTAAIKAAGVADKDIQTANVNVYPQYGKSGNKVVGYQASISLDAKVRDLASLSKVIDAASAAGSQNISGPTFSISEDAVYSDQATQKAVDDARRSAASMAKAAGKQLGGVVSITSNNVASPQFGIRFGAFTPSTANVPIQPGQLDVVSNLTIVFALK